MTTIKDIYFQMCKINNKGHLVLLIKKSGLDLIFFSEKQDEILNFITSEDKNNITSIYISSIINKELVNEINKFVDIDIFISPENNIIDKNVKYCNEFKNSKIDNLLKNNKYFKQCFDILLFKEKNEKRIINKLIDMQIIESKNNNLTFTNFGEQIFVDDFKKREVIIKDSSVYNSLYYTVEKSFSGPLFKIIDDTINYLMTIIPNIQERTSLQSKVYKLIDISLIEKLVYYCICNNDFLKNDIVEIELTKTSLNVLFFKNDSMIIKKFFEYYSSNYISYENLVSDFKERKMEINKRTNNMKNVKIKILLANYILNEDKLDDIDLEIILFAKNNPNFSRKMIDQTFNISSRNSNNRIKRLIDQNILKSHGISKATRYNIIDYTNI